MEASTLIHLDTHVVAWLFEGATELLPPSIIEQLEREDVVVSPMVIFELDYLHEIGRVKLSGARIVSDLNARIDLRTSDVSFARVVEEASLLTWTRDPFDRLIVANARVDGASLVTRDETIRRHESSAVWDGTTSRRARRSKKSR